MHRTWFAICFFLLLPSVASPIRAETLYRCIDARGQVSYQSQTCAMGQRLDRTLEYRPDPVSPARMRPATAKARTSAARNSRPRITGERSADTANARCRASKASRDAGLQQLGLSRTYDQLSRLDAQVRAACRGF